ncbi:hypothetical protein LCGC14_2945670 [marine sediment metagenome]|uniref:BppU N-terminal domain-containing protein n=1 Tax=marine sediment metagenome TaxID=412755 RepID=A0A0F8XH90_9ZZZZ
MTQVIFNKNDNLLEVVGLKNVVTDTFINTATVTATLVDSKDVNVVGESWPITLSYVAASDGLYQAILKDTMTLVSGGLYTAKIDADDGPNKRAHWEFPVRAETRLGS